MQLLVEFLPSAILVFALEGLLEPFLGIKIDLVARSGIAIALGALYVPLLRWVSSGESTHWLRTDVDAFADFYTAWYSGEGTIHVHCRDLLWLDDTGRESIVHALEKKGPEANIYLRNLSGKTVETLGNKGVHIHEVPDKVQLLVKFSVREDNDHRKIMIRLKVAESMQAKKNQSREKVQESCDENLIALALEYLSSLRPAPGPTPQELQE